MQQCHNCQQLIDQSKFDLHHNYCIRNIKKCIICKGFYDKNQEEDHLQYDCKSNVKLKCTTCQKQFDNKNQLLNHLDSKQCNQEINKNRKQSCRFCQYCLLDVPMQSYDEHLSYCQSRTKTCDHCGQGVMNKKFAEHIVNCEEQLLNKALLMSQDQNEQTRLYKPSQSEILPNVYANNQSNTYTNYVNQTSVITNNSNNNYTAYTTTYTTSDANNNPQTIKKQTYSYSNPVTVTRYVYKPQDANRVIHHQSKVVGVRQTIIRNPQPLLFNKKIETVPQQSKNGSNISQSQKSSIQNSVSIPYSSYTYSNNGTLSSNDRNLPSTTIADTRTTAFTSNSAAFQNSYSQSGYYPSYNPSQTRSEHYNISRTNPISSTNSNQNILYNQSFDEYQFGHENSQEQMMQAALMASMGMLDQKSMSQDSKIYRQIQDQKEIQKSIKK